MYISTRAADSRLTTRFTEQHMYCTIELDKLSWTQLQDEVFWVVTPRSVVVGYQRFRGPGSLHLQDKVVGMWGNCIYSCRWGGKSHRYQL